MATALLLSEAQNFVTESHKNDPEFIRSQLLATNIIPLVRVYLSAKLTKAKTHFEINRMLMILCHLLKLVWWVVLVSSEGVWGGWIMGFLSHILIYPPFFFGTRAFQRPETFHALPKLI